MKLSRLTRILFGLFALVLLQTITTGTSSGRNDNRACTDMGCHGSNAFGTMTLTGIPAQVTPSTTYSGQICIDDPIYLNGGVGGFRLHISQGTYSNLGAGVRTGGTGTNLGLTHASPKPITGPPVCWDFDWTSPVSGNSNVQLYGNASNGDNNNNSADQGGYVYFTVIEVVDPCISDLIVLDNPIPTNTYQASNSITANTPIDNNANVLFDVQNCVDLQADFEVPLGATFETLVGSGQGCLTTSGSSNSATNNSNKSE